MRLPSFVKNGDLQELAAIVFIMPMNIPTKELEEAFLAGWQAACQTTFTMGPDYVEPKAETVEEKKRRMSLMLPDPPRKRGWRLTPMTLDIDAFQDWLNSKAIETEITPQPQCLPSTDHLKE